MTTKEYHADEMRNQERHLVNGVTQKKHRPLWPIWGTPSTQPFRAGGGPNLRRAWLAQLGGPTSVPPFFAVVVGRVSPPSNQSKVPKHSHAFVATLGHPQHAPALGGGATISAVGLRGVARGPDICAAIFCGRRRPRQPDIRPINNAKTFTGVCGHFGAPPARPRIVWWGHYICSGPAARCSRARYLCRHFLRSSSAA